MINTIASSRGLAAALLASAAAPAFAQTGPAPQATAEQQAMAYEGIAEIVVTAQKRAENL